MTVVLFGTDTSRYVTVPKLGARHMFDGLVTLGDPTAWPKFRLHRVDGLGSLGERDDQRDPAYGRTGEIPRRSERRGKTVTYEGAIHARTFGEMRYAETVLTRAFASTSPRRMDILTPLDAAQPEMWYSAESMACDVVDEQTLPDGGMLWQRPFTIAVRMADPRVFEATEIVTHFTANPQGLTFPQTLPVTLPTNDPTVALASDGTAPTDPIIDVAGPFTALRVENLTLGRKLVIPTLPVSVGSFARVDFANRTVMIDAAGDASGLVDFAESDWWDIDQWGLVPPIVAPGVAWTNVLRALDPTTGAPLSFTASYFNATWG